LSLVTILATSALIAHAAGAMLAPAKVIETGTSVTSVEQSGPAQIDKSSASARVASVEVKRAMARVWCPSEPDVSTDVQIVSLQDLDVLMASQCVVRSGESR
jgi:hypothetical protein